MSHQYRWQANSVRSKMFTVAIVNIVIFCWFIQCSGALQCFQCESYENPKCIDLSDGSLQPKECVVQEGHLKMGHSAVCIKITAFNNGVVTRGCSSAKSLSDADDSCKFQLEWRRHKNPTEYCGHCSNENGCNTADSMKFSFSFVIFGTVLSTARLFS